MPFITKTDMNNTLSNDKGWQCSEQHNQYVYDFHLSKYPIIIKVLSSVSVDEDITRHKMKFAVIKVFAVKKQSIDKNSKIVGGLVKQRLVLRDKDWEYNLKKEVMNTIQWSKIVYDKQNEPLLV